jgi:hypothetical protein
MLEVLTSKHRCCDGVTRRHFLRAGLMGLGGLSLTDCLRLQAAQPDQTQVDRETSVVVIWLQGGPSHLEMYDLKPKAPQEIRGPFHPIATNVPGLDVCELLPLHAKIADRFTLIRSVHHRYSCHNDGTPMMTSGYPDWDDARKEPVYPDMGTVVNRVFGTIRDGLPVAMGMGARHWSYVPTTAPGYWSNAFRPPTVDQGLPNSSLTIDGEHFRSRRELLDQFDRIRRDLDVRGVMDSLDDLNQQAVQVLTGNKARAAFDVSNESQATRDRYGSGWGQQALQARRLIEAGVKFVTVSVPGGKLIYNWDDHAVNGDLPSAMRERLPGFDQGVTALIEDIHERGLNEKTLVVVTGEFGRTPRMNQQKGNSNGALNWGRDHWPNAMSILVSGGGRRMGQVIGATNAHGEYPSERPLTPQDLLATIYQHLGIDHHRSFVNPAGRPIALSTGTPIAGL